MSDTAGIPTERDVAEKIVDGAKKIVSRGGEGMQPGDVGEIEDPDAPDAEIFAADGANIGFLHVMLGAQDGVPYVSLVELEHLFANLYEDISERQAKEQRAADESEAEKLAYKRRVEEEQSVAESRDGCKDASEPEALEDFDLVQAARRELMDRIAAGTMANQGLTFLVWRLG